MIWTKLINCHHHALLADRFGINKTPKLIARKYYEPIFCKYVKTYVQKYDIYLVL